MHPKLPKLKNLQKMVRDRQLFNTFWLRNVLCAIAACTFSTRQLPKTVPTCGIFNVLHGTVPRATPARTFSTNECPETETCFYHLDLEPRFAPQPHALLEQLQKMFRRWGAFTILTSKSGKNTAFRDFSTFWRTLIFFLSLTLSLLRSSFHWLSLFLSLRLFFVTLLTTVAASADKSEA